MADQDAKTGMVDPRPEEMNTGAKSGQASGTTAPKTDAAGKDLADVSGSGPAPAPAPANSQETPSVASSTTGAASSGGEASAKTDPVKSLIEEHASDDKEAKAAIIDVATGVRSVSNTTGMVQKASTQSVDSQTGAQVAHDNAFRTLVKRVETLCQKIGKEAAETVTKELAKFHGAEDAVKNVLKQAGVSS